MKAVEAIWGSGGTKLEIEDNGSRGKREDQLAGDEEGHNQVEGGFRRSLLSHLTSFSGSFFV